MAAAVKSCPEVTALVKNAQVDWSAELGMDAGDAATMRAGVAASLELDAHAAESDARLKDACNALARDLGASAEGSTATEACQIASQQIGQVRAQLGAGAQLATERAQAGVSVHVTGAQDAEAETRLTTALEKDLPALVAALDLERQTRAAIAKSKAALELSLVTGQAVSQGDAAAAAAAALCILPPLLAAKQRITTLREELRLSREVARAAGLELPHPPPEIETPLAAHTTVGRGAPPEVPAPLQGRVSKMFGTADGTLAVQVDDRIVALPSGQELLALGRPGNGVAVGHTWCDVGPGAHAACLREEHLFGPNGASLGARVVLIDANGAQAIASVGERGQAHADGIGFDASGALLLAYTLEDIVGGQPASMSRVVRGGQQLDLPWTPEHSALEELGGNRPEPPIRFLDFGGQTRLFYRSGRKLLTSPLARPGAPSQVAERSAYDVRPIAGGDGVLYVFYCEPKSRTARVAVSNDGASFRDVVLDTRESGWQLEAIPTETGAAAVYYYFRNTYNKGLRAVALHDGQLAHAPIAILREDRWNAGWHPYLAAARGQGVWLSYLSNVEKETRAWSHFDTPENLFDFAVAGDGTSEDNYKNWFVQVGAGVWYTWFAAASKLPDAGDVDGPLPGKTHYRIDPALLVTANLEARFGPIDLGLSYAQNYLDKAAKKFGDSTGVLSGQLQIDDLLPGHDVKAEGTWGRYHGSASRGGPNGPEALELNTSYVDTRLYALNEWRIKYGLGFAHYTLPTPVQAYYANANEVHYTYAGSALRNVRYNDLMLALGYSKLDYTAKYENDYFGPFVDFTLAFGLSFASFDAVPTPAGDVSSDVELQLRGGLRAGWLWMDRSRALSGLGFYLRPAYALDGQVTGTANRPKDRKQSDASSADKLAALELQSLRHGPWLDVGVVW